MSILNVVDITMRNNLLIRNAKVLESQPILSILS